MEEVAGLAMGLAGHIAGWKGLQQGGVAKRKAGSKRVSRGSAGSYMGLWTASVSGINFDLVSPPYRRGQVSLPTWGQVSSPISQPSWA